MSKTRDKKIKLKLTHLSRLQRVEVDACMLCGACVEVSPIFEEIGKESVTCRGKIQALKKFVKSNYGIRASLLGTKPINEKAVDEFVEALYSCTLCGACQAVCEAKIYTPDLWEAARADMVANGKGPMPKQKAWPKLIEEKHNPYNQPPEDRVKWLTEGASTRKTRREEKLLRDGGGVSGTAMPDGSQSLGENIVALGEAAGIPKGTLVEKADIAYFVGCTSAYKVKNLAQATMRILSKIGVKFTMLGSDEYCCGSPLLRTGQLDQVKNLVKHNVDALAAKGAKTVIFSCSGCYRTALIDWPRYYGKLPFKLMHITQFLAEMIQQGKLKIKKHFDEVVTYHDPCHLGRHVGVFDAPRIILQSIPGLRLVEMDRTKMHSRCCGAGGGVKAGIPELAMEIATTRLREAQKAKDSSPVRTAGARAEEAVAAGATTLTTACPFCYVNLGDGIKSRGFELKMYDIVLLVDELLSD
jgi:heterodisulfide reductase subunit D